MAIDDNYGLERSLVVKLQGVEWDSSDISAVIENIGEITLKQLHELFTHIEGRAAHSILGSVDEPTFGRLCRDLEVKHLRGIARINLGLPGSQQRGLAGRILSYLNSKLGEPTKFHEVVSRGFTDKQLTGLGFGPRVSRSFPEAPASADRPAEPRGKRRERLSALDGSGVELPNTDIRMVSDSGYTLLRWP